MPTPTTPTPRGPSKLLFQYADGGALRDLNDRLRAEDDRRRLDFRQLPELVAKRLKDVDNLTTVDSPKEGRIFFTLGATSAKTFVEEMGTAWTVMTVPLGLCRYDRNPIDHGDHVARETFKVRFHALIGYHLGFLAGKRQSFSRDLTVAVISDDPQLLPALADANRQGLDTRLVWPESALPEETRYFAGRNGVSTLLVHPEVLSTSAVASQGSYLNTLLKLGK